MAEGFKLVATEKLPSRRAGGGNPVWEQIIRQFLDSKATAAEVQQTVTKTVYAYRMLHAKIREMGLEKKVAVSIRQKEDKVYLIKL